MRSYELEFLDTGDYTQEEYRECLKQLGRVGALLGGDRATMWALKQLDSPVGSLLDVGCGGGFFLASLRKRYSDADLHGIDLNPDAITHAQSAHSDLNFSCTPLEQIDDNAYEVVISTLVCHHLQDEELGEFLQQCRRVARRCVVINDLHRHPLATASYALIAPWLFRNRLITHDGLLSIRRAFTRADWERILRQAGIEAYQLTWRFPFRWIVRF